MSDFSSKGLDNPVDPKGNIELCHFGDTALLFRPGAVMPYVVADNYDRENGEWSSGSYFDDLGRAFEAADPEIIEDASLRVTRGDVRQGLEDMNVEVTPQNEFEVETSLKEIVSVAGPDIVHKAIQECIEESLIEAKQLDGESLDEMMSAKESEAEIESNGIETMQIDEFNRD